ncbi:MAG: HAMP domain-containing protein, partial [Chloroflexi bacterium]|nr:HAMP domain-containing protein [Chloroflexota bacterium]
MKIRQKTLIVIFVVVLVTGAVTTIVGRTIAMNIVEDEISDHLVTTAQSRAQTVRLALESQQQGIEILAREAEAYMATMQPGGLGFLVKDRLVVSVLLNGIASSMEQVRDALCLDQNGIVVAATSERFLGFDASDWEVFSELSKGNRNTFVGDIQDSPLGEFVNGEAASEFLLATAAPFRTAGDLEGVVVFLGGEKELSEITTDVTGLGKTGEVYLVNSDGFMLTESRFREDAIMQVKTDTAGGSGDSEGAGQELISTTSYMGSKVLRICEPLPETGWTVVVEMGSSEAFAPVSTLTRVMLWSLLGVLLLGVVAAIGISKALTRPIVRLHRGAEEVMRGNWDCSLSTSAKDEIGELSRAFGKMTANLKRSHEELRHYSESLETKVEERTRALATANEELNREIIERKQAEKALQEAHDELEMRVLERTEQLAETNAILEEEIMERKRAEEEALQRNRELAALNALAQTINQS